MAERLSLLDASFLAQETARTPLHAGGVAIFEPGLTFAGVMDVLRRRLAALPLARQRVREVAFGAGRPLWVDDDHFDLSYHLRHAQLPPPGGRSDLEEFCARLIARPLDRSRPLWELYVIGGLEGGRTALFRKVHLAMSGGEKGDPFGVLLDDRAEVPDRGPLAADRWEPEEGPGTASLAVSAVRDRLEQAAGAGRALVQTAADPRRLVGSAAAAASSAVGLLGRVVGGAPASPLNRRLTQLRLYGLARASLDDFRLIRRAVGGSINDVVVAVVGDAVGRMLREHGYDTKDLDLRVMVPVRVHGEEPGSEATPLGQPRMVGDGVVGVLCPLPVMEMDPVARLYRVIGEMSALQESRQAVAADALVRLAGFAPPNMHARAARVASAEARYNVALSNAPGPQEPRYLAGRRMEEAYPYIPLAGDSALSVAVSSYAGAVFFGLLGERSGMPDLELLTGDIGEAVGDLVAAADAAR